MMSACSGGNQVGAKTEERGLVMELKQKKIYTLAQSLLLKKKAKKSRHDNFIKAVVVLKNGAVE